MRRIYDAQLIYFTSEIKPTRMIEKFREKRLIALTTVIVSLLTVAYLILALCLNYVPDEYSKLYLLPTIDTQAFSIGMSDVYVKKLI